MTQAPAPAKTVLPGFVIDRDGFARRTTGERVMPGHVNDVIFDQRGEHGDLSAITWGDDSRGVRGLQMTIAAA